MKLRVILITAVFAISFLATGILYAGNGDLIVNGNLGVHTPNPGAEAEVNGNMIVDGSSTVKGNTTMTGTATMNGNAIVNGNLGVGTATPTEKVEITGNLKVNGKVNGDLIVNGNIGIGTTGAPISKLDITNYTFVKMGQAAIFLKNNAYISSTIPLDPTVVGEAKNVNGVIYTRAHAGTDSGWVAGLSATCLSSTTMGSTYKVTTNLKGLIVEQKPYLSSSYTIIGEANW